MKILLLCLTLCLFEAVKLDTVLTKNENSQSPIESKKLQINIDDKHVGKISVTADHKKLYDAENVDENGDETKSLDPEEVNHSEASQNSFTNENYDDEDQYEENNEEHFEGDHEHHEHHEGDHEHHEGDHEHHEGDHEHHEGDHEHHEGDHEHHEGEQNNSKKYKMLKKNKNIKSSSINREKFLLQKRRKQILSRRFKPNKNAIEKKRVTKKLA